MVSGGLLLTLIVLASGAATKAAKESAEHGAGSTKHGKQEHDIDGHHNVHFDHEAILGNIPCLFHFMKNELLHYITMKISMFYEIHNVSLQSEILVL